MLNNIADNIEQQKIDLNNNCQLRFVHYKDTSLRIESFAITNSKKLCFTVNYSNNNN